MDKILLPILTFQENYLYRPTAPQIYSQEDSISYFTSQGRLTPICEFTQFLGPDFSSQKLVVISPGQEAIFAKIPNAIYSVKWNIRKNKNCHNIQFWTINIEKNLAYQLYSTNGNLMKLRTKRGEACVYGFQFPIVVELPLGEHVDLEFKLEQQLLENDPLFPGAKCLVTKCGSEEVYRNSTTIKSGIMHRTVVSSLEDRNREIRKKYYSVFKKPCKGITSTLGSPKQDINIEGQSTLTWYTANVAAVTIFNNEERIPFWCSINSSSHAPLSLTYAVSGEAGNIFSYGFVPTDGIMQFTFNIVLGYERSPVVFGNVFGWYQGFGVYPGKSLLQTPLGENASIQGIFHADSVTYQGTVDVSVEEKQYLWFGGYGFINYNSGTRLPPLFVGGEITCKYI